jgi:hypothetical protein
MRKLHVSIVFAMLGMAVRAAEYRMDGPANLNDLATTPGATLSVSIGKLCTPGYTRTVRNVPAAVKKQVCEEYRVPAERCTGAYVEIDHLISLELGGSNDPANLWPQPYQPKPGAREKDRLENWLHRQVCDGVMSLVDAQQAIAEDWYSAYRRMLGAITFVGAERTSTAPVASEPPAPTDAEGAAYDFAISPEFLQRLESGHSIQPTLRLKLGDHSGVHKLSDDCELHVAGQLERGTLGWPEAVVSEPPNVCKNAPSAVGGRGDWMSLFDGVVGSTCDVRGYPRIFTEHASGASGASNPNHVFEVHPATGMTCGQTRFDFGSMLTVYPGMRAISPSTAASCIGDRKLFVRYDQRQKLYVFREEGGRCGNFAIVEVQNLLAKTIRDVGDGHSAIARVSADGQSIVTLKLYTLAPSDADKALAQGGGFRGDRVLLHGLFTYDYFAIQRALHPRGHDWLQPTDWAAIRFPLAFVVFGQTQTAPWEGD